MALSRVLSVEISVKIWEIFFCRYREATHTSSRSTTPTVSWGELNYLSILRILSHHNILSLYISQIFMMICISIQYKLISLYSFIAYYYNIFIILSIYHKLIVYHFILSLFLCFMMMLSIYHNILSLILKGKSQTGDWTIMDAVFTNWDMHASSQHHSWE